MSNKEIIKIQTHYGEIELHIPNPAGCNPASVDAAGPTCHEIKKGRGRPRKIKANVQQEQEQLNIFEPAIQEPEPKPEPKPEPEQDTEHLYIHNNNDIVVPNQEIVIIPDVEVLVHKKRGRPLGSRSTKTQFKELYYHFL